MKEFSDAAPSNMQPAPALTPAPVFRQDFELNRELPGPLGRLDEISANFFWSWHPDGVELFRELDPSLWNKCEQTPRLLLKRIGELRLWQTAADAAYID